MEHRLTKFTFVFIVVVGESKESYRRGLITPGLLRYDRPLTK